ncbi:unnamed protein product [Parnassius apollo]|uniref:(apollo) hypothetical protein n=1 Tax=Parnassius apollo TaxID=110799 RepID=A0A8S3Y5Z6_PARAO|nr:unnamed protein product [Parnassius apollo]
MHFEYDPERLIEAVRKRPGIWDFEDVAYRAKAMRQKLWTDVVNELMEADVKVTKSEMRELELQLQKKWKSIRDCFQKYVMNQKRSKRPYIYSKKLQFLLKGQDPTEPCASTDSEGGDKKSSIWKTKRKLKIRKESSDDEDNDNYNDIEDSKSNCSNEIIETQTPAKKSKMNSVVVDEFAFANVDSQVMNDSEDCDKLFLLSLLPHLKSIPEEFRLNVKMEMMNVLRNANLRTSIDHKIL